ncbi:MAG: NAD(P)H-hydrate dehydratase [Prevotella sp.]|nr:NAD(P)H-hydrate dehydratase [Prevotella sp.]MBQ8628462.1 NAD(P)H-hydrate dehydratase [Prevotella sp.]
MKIFTATQIRELDRFTIEHEPIKSVDLMERAARALTWTISETWSNEVPFVVFAGPGNNGGDALAVARMLAEKGYKLSVYLFNISNKLSEDCAINRQRIVDSNRIKSFTEVKDEFDPPRLEKGTVIIDGLFGSGLNKPLAGGFASLVRYINKSQAEVVSIDMPSGLMAEDNTYNIGTNIIQADLTLTLQHKKLAFLFAENQQFIGKLKVLDIRLSKEGEEILWTRYSIAEENDIRKLLLKRNEFAHKGEMGHALLLAGCHGMAGAAILAARACLRAGSGKVTVRTARRNNDIMQISVPEAIVSADKEDHHISEALPMEDYDAVGIGPGIGTNEHTAIAIITQIRRSQVPIVLDADALNILASHRAWLQQLPPGVIMTPHPKEMERMAGNRFSNSYERLCKAQDMAEQLKAYILLKGKYTALCTPDGNIIFNSTGNAGMATAGSGDVLTGIITGLLARGYQKGDACLLGMYLHGLAGDLAARELGEESLVASDIIAFLPKAFNRLND